MPDRRNAEKETAARDKAGNKRGASTLLPMLVVGLVLIVIGGIVVMWFV